MSWRAGEAPTPEILPMLLEAKKLLCTLPSWAAGYRTIAPEARVPPLLGMSVLIPIPKAKPLKLLVVLLIVYQ